MIRNHLSKEAWRAEQVLAERYGSFLSARNLKDLFCESNGNHELCQRDPNG